MMGMAAGMALVRAAAGRLHDHAVRHDALPGADSRRRLLSQRAGDDRRRRRRPVVRRAGRDASFVRRHRLSAACCRNMTVVCPGDAVEARLVAARGARRRPLPLTFAWARKANRSSTRPNPISRSGKAITVRDGNDVASREHGQHAARRSSKPPTCWNTAASRRSVVSMHTVKPLDETMLGELFASHSLVATIEEHSRHRRLGRRGGRMARRISNAEGRAVAHRHARSFLHEAGDQEHARAIWLSIAPAITHQVLTHIRRQGRTESNRMKTTAAILVQTGQPLELAELEIPGTRAGTGARRNCLQRRLSHAAAGSAAAIAATTRSCRTAWGTKGAALSSTSASDVTKCQPGDRVILSWIKGSGANVPGTVYAWNGKKVNAGGVTTFSRHAVVSENRITRHSPESFDLLHAALIGCAVPTGRGVGLQHGEPAARTDAWRSSAQAESGCVPFPPPSFAALHKSLPSISMPTVSRPRRRWERPKQSTRPNSTRSSACCELCTGGVDMAIEASGRPNVMVQALRAVRERGGTAVVIGNAHHGENIELDPGLLNLGKRLVGTWGGDNDPDSDFPLYCELISSARLPLQPLLSDPYPLANINLALDDLEDRKVARPLIDMKL